LAIRLSTMSTCSHGDARVRELNECVVVVTPRTFDADLRRQLAERVSEVRYVPGPLAADELAEALADADAVIAGLDELSSKVFSHAPRLKVVARYGVGLDSVDLDAARRHGVTVTFTPDANANAVAELTVGFMFLLCRRLVPALATVQGGGWRPLGGFELQGRTLGLLGLGRIGSLVAHKAAALGMRVVGCDPYVDHSPVELVSLSELASTSDFISLHAPLTEETRQLVGGSFLGVTKRGAFLINTARGELVDETALLWALDEGLLAGAALDVLAVEPPPPDHPLRNRNDVLVTPHLAAHTLEATSAMSRAALDDVLAVLSGCPPRFAVPG
jgi:phosphoglycerate dehydrogenase-like enzyme